MSFEKSIKSPSLKVIILLPLVWLISLPLLAAPTVKTVNPADGATNVSRNSSIQVNFSEEMSKGTYYGNIFLKDSSGNTVSGSTGPGSNFYQIHPYSTLEANTTYTLHVTTGVQDENGNPLEEAFTSSFTTEANDVETTSPTVSSVNPADGATNVSRNSSIQVNFSEEMSKGTYYGNIFLKDSSGNTVSGSTGPGSNFYQIHPYSTLEACATYIVHVTTGVQDENGNPLEEAFTSSFTTAVGDNCISLFYAGDSSKPVAGVKITMTESDGTVTILATDINGQITLPSTSNTFTLNASFSEEGEDPITLVDALQIIQYAGELRTLTADQLKAADVNSDGEVDVLDALWIVQHLGELRTLDSSLVFLDAATGKALSETTFNPTDTPSITVIRKGDVDQSYDPTTINAAALNARSILITGQSKTDTTNLNTTDFNIEDYNQPPYLDLWTTKSEGTVNVGSNTVEVSNDKKGAASFRFIHFDDISKPTFTYGSGDTPIASVKVTMTESDGTITVLVTDSNGQIKLPTTTNTFTLNASLTETSEDPISLIDAIWILQHAGELRTLTASQLLAADVSGDGEVDVLDAIWILQHLGELRTLDSSIVFLDAATGKALNKTTFNPTDTPSITVIRMGDVDQSFDPTAMTWVQRGSDIDGELQSDYSGESISLSNDGNTVAIGAPGHDGYNYDNGQVRIYDWSGTAWVQRGLDIDGEPTVDGSGDGDEDGTSVSLSKDGNTVAIGAPRNDGSGNNAGYVRIFDWNGSAWSQKGIGIKGESMTDRSGKYISLSNDGNTVAIGALNNDGNGSNSGHVRIFDWNGSAWSQRGIDIDGEFWNDYSGCSVSMSDDGNTVAIGAPNNDGNGTDSGHVSVFNWDGSAWVQRGNDIDGEFMNDFSGYSVSMSDDGNTVAIGAPNNDSIAMDTGHVRVFDWSGTAWVKRGSDIDGKAKSDALGSSLSMNDDGATMAIGASVNIGGWSSGLVRIFDWNGSAWSQRGIDIEGPESNGKFAYSVSISNNGRTVAVGAVWGMGSYFNSGYVRIFDWK